MAEDERSERTPNDEIAVLEEADRKGKINIVRGIINDNEVQQVIKTALLRETIKNSILMACLLVGLLKLYDVAKILIGFNWVGDLLISIILILVGLIYMLKNILIGQHGWSRKDKSSQS
jgi:hypothetical protein